MTLDPSSFLLGVVLAVAVFVAWEFGQQRSIRLARRIARHGRDLDRVFFEDAERDATITRPEPATAQVHKFEKQSEFYG